MERDTLKSALVEAAIGGNMFLEREFKEMLQIAKNDQRGSEELGQALLLSVIEFDKEAVKRIRITQMPRGPAPDDIKSKWIGLEFLAIQIPKGLSIEFNFLNGEPYPKREGYAVYVPYAVNKLMSRYKRAAEWFRKNFPQNDALFGFGKEEVEIID